MAGFAVCSQDPHAAIVHTSRQGAETRVRGESRSIQNRLELLENHAVLLPIVDEFGVVSTHALVRVT
jgi:hypothetical protein